MSLKKVFYISPKIVLWYRKRKLTSDLLKHGKRILMERKKNALKEKKKQKFTRSRIDTFTWHGTLTHDGDEVQQADGQVAAVVSPPSAVACHGASPQHYTLPHHCHAGKLAEDWAAPGATTPPAVMSPGARTNNATFTSKLSLLKFILDTSGFNTLSLMYFYI